MWKDIEVSNTTRHALGCNYRMPGLQDGKPNPMLRIVVAPYALNQRVSFPDENYYNEFRKQNLYRFEGSAPILIEGHTIRKSKLEQANEKVEKEEASAIDKAIEKDMAQVSKVAEDTAGVGIKVTTRKVSKKGK